MANDTVSFDDVAAEYMKNPEFAKGVKIAEMRLKIGEALFKARLDKMLTQKKLAMQSNVPQKTIEKIEQGEDNISIDAILKVALTLGQKLVLLLTWNTSQRKTG